MYIASLGNDIAWLLLFIGILYYKTEYRLIIQSIYHNSEATMFVLNVQFLSNWQSWILHYSTLKIEWSIELSDPILFIYCSDRNMRSEN